MTERAEGAAEAGIGGDQGGGFGLFEEMGELGGVAANFVAGIGEEAAPARQDRLGVLTFGTGFLRAFARRRERAGLMTRGERAKTGCEAGEAEMDGGGEVLLRRAEGATRGADRDGAAERVDDAAEASDMGV